MKKAMIIIERLVYEEGRKELEYDLSWVYMMCAQSSMDLEKYDSALQILDKSITIRRRLVEEKNRTELRGELAKTQVFRGELLIRMDREAEGRKQIQDAVVVLEAELEATGLAEYSKELKRIREAGLLNTTED